ncbi:MAG: hypothetical protein ACKVTZ_16330 [Bacteroidia bacterium]
MSISNLFDNAKLYIIIYKSKSWFIFSQKTISHQAKKSIMPENQLIIERILQFIKFKNLSIRKFEAQLGFSNGIFSTAKKQNSALGVDKILTITQHYPELSIEWLLTGEGEMLKISALNSVESQVEGEKEIAYLKQLLAEKERLIQVLLKQEE